MAYELTTSECRSCKARIIWASTGNAAMPVDAEPVEHGNVLVVFDPQTGSTRATVVGPDQMTFPGEVRYVAHFTTCPQAANWRRRNGKIQRR